MIDLSVRLPGDVTFVASPKPGDLVALEQHFACSVPSMNFGFQHMMFLAWRCARRAGHTSAELDVFTEQVEALEVVEGKADGTTAPAT